MIEYFAKANSMLNCKMGFVHTFTAMNCYKPTVCQQCSGIVSMLIHFDTLDCLSRIRELRMKVNRQRTSFPSHDFLSLLLIRSESLSDICLNHIQSFSIV